MTDKQTSTAWVAWGNKDQTEGRGPVYPYAVCDCEATARRKAVGIDTQGSTGNVTKVELVMVQIGPSQWDSCWYGPVYIEQPNSADIAYQRVAVPRSDAGVVLHAQGCPGLNPEACRDQPPRAYPSSL
jgi:hypothetical protein